MAARWWCCSDRVTDSRLTLGIDALFTPPSHRLNSVLAAHFPRNTILAPKTNLTWHNGVAILTIGFSYTGPPLVAIAGDVTHILIALQTPKVVHQCPPAENTMNWIRCDNNFCSRGCTAPGGEAGWFLTACCGLSHIPLSALNARPWTCQHCTPKK